MPADLRLTYYPDRSAAEVRAAVLEFAAILAEGLSQRVGAQLEVPVLDVVSVPEQTAMMRKAL